MADIYTVAEAFADAGFPVPDGARIYYEALRHLNRKMWITHIIGCAVFPFIGTTWAPKRPCGSFLAGEDIDLSNLPAKDAWEQLPAVVRDHPAVVAAMEGER